MKKISKRSLQELQKHTLSRPSSFINAEIITQVGHFVKPSSHTSFANDKIQILCKGYGTEAL